MEVLNRTAFTLARPEPLVDGDRPARDLHGIRPSRQARHLPQLRAPPPPSRDPVDPGGADTLIFVNAEETDLEAARAIIAFFAAHGVGSLPPVRGIKPEAIRTALKTRMLACDGMILVHGTNPDWPILQWTQFRKVKAERESPIRAVGLCDLPPSDKPMSAADVLHIPSAHIIDCRDGLIPEKFATFLRAL